MNKISVFSVEEKFTILEKKATVLARRVLEKLEKDQAEIEIFFISGAKMRQINKKYRGKDSATNILSFNEVKGFAAPDSKFLKLGEIYMCPPLVSDFFEIKNKKIPGGLFSLEFLLIHGILHLLGYDHIKKNDRMVMEKLENEIYRNI